ncbi:uncharacterized protein LOC144436289 [Glandiceps talaboti]
MDSFFAQADDLDKMLDDFEREETHGNSHIHSIDPKTKEQHYTNQTINQANQNGIATSNNLYNMEKYGEHLTPVDLIDLSEADFAPAPETSLPYLSAAGPPTQNNTPMDGVVFTGSISVDSQAQARESRTRSDSNTMLADQDFSSYLPTNLPHSISLENLQRMNSAAHSMENQINNSDRPQLPQPVEFNPAMSIITSSRGNPVMGEINSQNSMIDSSLVTGQTPNCSTSVMNSAPQISRTVAGNENLIQDLRTNSGAQPVMDRSYDLNRESLQMPTSNLSQEHSVTSTQQFHINTTQMPPESPQVITAMTASTTSQVPIEHSSNENVMSMNPPVAAASSLTSAVGHGNTPQMTTLQSKMPTNVAISKQAESPNMATLLQEESPNMVESPNMATLKPAESPNMVTLQQVDTPNMATTMPMETPNMVTATTESPDTLKSDEEPRRPGETLQASESQPGILAPTETNQQDSQLEMSSQVAMSETASSMEMQHPEQTMQPHKEATPYTEALRHEGMPDAVMSGTEVVSQPDAAPAVESSQSSIFTPVPTAMKTQETSVPSLGFPSQANAISVQEEVKMTPPMEDSIDETEITHSDMMQANVTEPQQKMTVNQFRSFPSTQPSNVIGFGNIDNVDMSPDEMDAFLQSDEDSVLQVNSGDMNSQVGLPSYDMVQQDCRGFIQAGGNSDAFLQSTEDSLPQLNSGDMNSQVTLPSYDMVQQESRGFIRAGGNSDAGSVANSAFTKTVEQTFNPTNPVNLSPGVNNLTPDTEFQSLNANFVCHPSSNPTIPHGNPNMNNINSDGSRNNPNPAEMGQVMDYPQAEQRSPQPANLPVQDTTPNDLMHDSAACAIEGLSLAAAATTQSMFETSTATATANQHSQDVTKPSDIENLRRKQLQQSPTKEVPSGEDTGDEAAAMSQSQSITSKQSVMRQSLHLDFNHPSQRRVQLDNQPSSQPPIHDESDGPVGGQDTEMTEGSVTEEDSESSEPVQVMHSPMAMVADPSLTMNENMPARFNLDLPDGAYQLGSSAPLWVPDLEAPNCMMCATKFTFTKRRHHCRACGKVFCSNCCNTKAKLQYMGNKEARVCVSCNNIMQRVEAIKAMNSPGGPGRSPNPNNPSEYCSTVPPLEQARHNVDQPPPSVMVPRSKSVLRRPNSEGSQRQREPRHVRFSDGIHPGGDLTDDSPTALSIRPPRTSRRVRSRNSNSSGGVGSARRHTANFPVSLIPKDDIGLPPVVVNTGVKGEYTLEENPNQENLMSKLTSDSVEPVVFVINKNLFVLVKIINLDCCVNRVCWCFTTKGMPIVGQDEIVIVVEYLPQEKTIPRDIFCHFNTVYEEACRNNTVTELGNTIFAQSFLGSREHGGFLYVRPTFQCLRKLLLPESPYLFGVLLQKWETPWAKLFPIRLMLRLGAEYRYYPCPLMSVRFRKPVYGEIGHTIMNLLADFKNYQYMLPRINGVVIHMEDRQTSINFPKNRYDDIMKVLNNSNEHVMAMASNFSTDADSHLVCIQNDDGHYATQAINIQNKPRKVTGASFVVFNGALKTSSGLMAKSSIVEDGLMVQIPPDSMSALRHAMREMKDFTISCGAIGAEQPEETVVVQWIGDDNKVNLGVVSPIDGKSMEGITSLRIQNGTDYMGENKTIRWTEVFFLQNDESVGQRCDAVELTRLAETLAQGCCIALTPCLDGLKEMNMSKIALRVTIGTERVGYEIGSNGKILPGKFMKELDNHLIPVITNAVTQQDDGPITLELIFYVLD